MPVVWAVGLALAGSGPWVPGSGQGNLYLGADVQQFRSITSIAEGQRSATEIGEGLNQLNAGAVLSYGLTARLEAELSLSAHWIHPLREDANVCVALGQGSCDPTNTVGAPRAHLKWLIADELSGAPLSFAVAGVARVGAWVAPFRDRLTNAGEGTLDGGGRISIGKSGGLADGSWSASVDSTLLARSPNTRRFPRGEGERSVPGAEWTTSTEVFLAPTPGWGVGPSAQLFWRPSGVDFDELAVDDPDRFGALRVMQLNVGGKFLVRDLRGNSFIVGVHRTAHAVNNPSDQWGFSAGVTLKSLFKQGD